MADKIVGVYDIKVDGALKSLNKLEKEVTDVGKTSSKSAKQTEQAYTKLSKNLSGSFKNMGRNLAGAFAIGSSVAIFASAVKGAVNVAKNFEAQMSRVRAITGATSKDFEKLSDDAKRLGGSTRFTATQVAELQEEYAKLGFNTSEILNATEATLSLATATGSDLAESANVAGAVLRAFGLDASETQRVVDVMALSFSKSALNMNDFAEAMKFVAPIAKSANIPIETTTALLGKLADSGLRGSIAGTGLKNLLSKLADENSKLAKELGFSVKNSDDLFRAFQQLKGGHIDLTKATELTDERSKAAFLTLINGIDSVEDLDAALNNAAGSSKEMADIMENNFAGSVTKLSSAWEGLMLTIAGSNGVLNDFVKGLTNLIQGYQFLLSDLDENLDIADTAKELASEFKKMRVDDLASGYRDINDIMLEMAERQIQVNEKTREYEALNQEIEQIRANGTYVPSQYEAERDALGNVLVINRAYVQALNELIEADKKSKEEKDKNTESTDSYTRSITQLNKELKELQKDFKGAAIGTNEFFAAADKVEAKIKEIDAAMRLLVDREFATLPTEGIESIAVTEVEVQEQLTEDLIDETNYRYDEINKLKQGYREADLEAEAEAIEKQKELFFDYANATGDLFANLSQIQRNLNEEELNNLAAQLERGEITREEYDAKRKEIMREQAESDKALAIFDATVNGASAIVNALSTDPTGVLAAIVGASVAAQIAAIASQPLPQFAEGGFINEHGEFVGRKHSQGGVRIEAEGGEFITAAKYAQPNSEILKAINSGSWEKYKVDNIIAPAIEQVLEGGLQGLGASYSLQNNFNDRNLLKAIDRHRTSDQDGFMYLAKELKRMNPRKRGGFA